ncbi:terminase small subunit [Herpetosiphon giganteus]|uniref:terminase small subunit n=1 Tax=Herpetosiphon giganteus TaxID=2029754 RepID=UPI001958C24B|nr:terminase small subunit [Herpetosiphon giganteus]MBM7843756.1 phage terminase small subunit [Herpetosiphon giganteus]
MTTNKAEKALTAKQRRFVDEYLVDFNATQAAIRAQYAERSARSIGSENLTKPEIQAEINRRLDSIMPKAEILGRLAQQARGTMQDFFFIGMEERTIEKRRIQISVDDKGRQGQEVILEETEEKAMRPAVYLSLVKAQNLGKMHLIKKYSLGPKGESIELYNAQDALTTLGKYHAMWVDRAEVTGEDGGPIEISEIVVKKSHERPPALDDD